MRIKARYIIVPCLLLSLVFCALNIYKTSAYFIDKKEYEYIIYPYHEDGEASLTETAQGSGSTEQSTVLSVNSTDTIVMNCKYTNHSNAVIKGMHVSLKINGNYTVFDKDINTPVQLNSSWEETKNIDPAVLLANSVPSGEYVKAELTCQVTSIETLDANGSVAVTTTPSKSTVYLKIGGDS